MLQLAESGKDPTLLGRVQPPQLPFRTPGESELNPQSNLLLQSCTKLF